MDKPPVEQFAESQEAKKKAFNAAIVARVKKLRAEFYSRPRDESLRRFIRRRTKPKQFRFQSLLRGAFAAKVREKRGIVG